MCKAFVVYLLFSFNVYLAKGAMSSDELLEITEICCNHGEKLALSGGGSCSNSSIPEEIDEAGRETCLDEAKSCCQYLYQKKKDCDEGLKFAESKRCSVPSADIGKTCCEECTFGRWAGESQGKDACGSPDGDEVSPATALRKKAFYQCCLEAAERPTTTEKPTTTPKPKTTTTQKATTKRPRETCSTNPCEQLCNDDGGKVTCQCFEGYRLQGDKKTCKDINECAEAEDDICNKEGTVCHNTPGSFRCVPLKKREVGLKCPPGFKSNVQKQVCDDINECQLPRPPCPKYLCENTVGGYSCAGKPGKPALEAPEGDSGPLQPEETPMAEKDDMCPLGFRAGHDDECYDIDECADRLDDCQRLSQHCINTHGSFFCQDHVSKRCAPGFKVNAATGICEDIDECETSPEDTCPKNHICVNLPGAYNCKHKTSTLPKLKTKSCQEGTRPRSGGTSCEDIDECREGTHLCDQFQNCINTYGGHECRCKSGFELDSASGSCVDVDECALKLDNCGPSQFCLNVLGTFTCTRQSPPVTISTTPIYDYEYYDSEEPDDKNPTSPSVTTTLKPTTTTQRPKPRPYSPPKPARTTTQRPTPRPRPKPASTLKPIPINSSTQAPSYVKPTETTTKMPVITTTPKPKPRPTPKPKPVTTSRPKPTTSPKSMPRPTPRPKPNRNNTPKPVTPPTTASTPFTNPPETNKSYPTRADTNEIEPKPTDKPSSPEIKEVSVPKPEKPDIMEKERNNDAVDLNTAGLPKNKWTNLVGKDSDPNFDSGSLHCLGGYEKNENGECVDIDECVTGRHICNSLEVCSNRAGGYLCECSPGHIRDPTGWCVQTTTSTTTTDTNMVDSVPERTYKPSYTAPAVKCQMGYRYETSIGRCIDIDECRTGRASCSPDEHCVNIEGGYKCVCGRRCSPEVYKPSYVSPTSAPRSESVVTVGSQYGSPGPRVIAPRYSGSSYSCPWGYTLTHDHRCLDIDECALDVSECGHTQRCENFPGGYSCQCPSGHRQAGRGQCEDIDECSLGNPCQPNSDCINTPGSYRCSCRDGFENAPSNDKVCIDIDECLGQTSGCAHRCVNVWGGFRCACERGYRLGTDNRTCEDIDECQEASTSSLRRLCLGECLNTEGSYSCGCPAGYRLGEDKRSCIDIDECESGEASCAQGGDGSVCVNTRGRYHCHKINCPPGYQLDSNHRCNRIQRRCYISDMSCMRQPSAYSYNFITFASNIYLPNGRVDLFTMRGPAWSDAVFDFQMKMIDVQTSSPSVRPMDFNCFDMRPVSNICVVSLLCSIQGPQVAELELEMSLYRHQNFAGTAVARLVIIVSEYEY